MARSIDWSDESDNQPKRRSTRKNLKRPRQRSPSSTSLDNASQSGLSITRPERGSKRKSSGRRATKAAKRSPDSDEDEVASGRRSSAKATARSSTLSDYEGPSNGGGGQSSDGDLTHDSSEPSPPPRRRNHHSRRSTRLNSRQPPLDFKPKARSPKSSNLRRSSRSNRQRGKLDFSVTSDQEEEDELQADDDMLLRARNPGRRVRRVMSTSEEGDSDSADVKRHSGRRPAAVVSKAPLRVGERPRDEHNPKCTRCEAEFKPDLLDAWIQADKKRKTKIRAGSLLDRFETVEDVYALGCWLECNHCTASYHFGCLPFDMRKDISTQHELERRKALEDLERRRAAAEDDYTENLVIPPRKKERQPDLVLSVVCPMCTKPQGCLCMKCRSQSKPLTDSPKDGEDVKVTAAAGAEVSALSRNQVNFAHFKGDSVSRAPNDQPLMFRCASCKCAAHYTCLPPTGTENFTDIDDIAEYWQRDWSCADCDELANTTLENILAWRRPTSKIEGGTNPSHPQDLVGSLRDLPRGQPKQNITAQLPSWKDTFAEAEYLCKYVDFSYSDCSWVAHSYLAAKYPSKLRNFLTKGPLVNLKQYSQGDDVSSDSDSNEDDDGNTLNLPFSLEPDEDAQLKIPKAWLTPELIMSVEFEEQVTIEDIAEADIPGTPNEMYEELERAFIKWEEQPYSAATWTDRPPKDSPYYPAFMKALEKFMKFRKFVVPVVKSEKELAKLDAPRRESQFVALENQPDFIPNQLMPFQLDGVNFTYYNWHRRHPTILADEMGLGKTVQICSLIAVLTEVEKRMPFLICVPNSTLAK